MTAEARTAGIAERRAVLDAFDRAFAREAHNLARWPGLTWQQLYNDLQFREAPIPNSLVAELGRRTGIDPRPWLRRRTPPRLARDLKLTITGHAGGVWACAVSPDSRFLVTGGGRLPYQGDRDYTLRLWNLETGEELRAFVAPTRASGTQGLAHLSDIQTCAVSPDGRFVVSGGRDARLRIWDFAEGALVHERLPRVHTKALDVYACSVSPDGSFLASAGEDGAVKVWDAETGEELRTLSGHSLKVSGCAITPDGGFVVSACSDGTMKVWNVGTGAEVLTLGRPGDSLRACAVSPDGRWVLSGGEGEGLFTALVLGRGGERWDPLHLWDLETGRHVRALEGHQSAVNACAVSPDGSFFVSGGDDETVRVWDAGTGEELRTLLGHTGPVRTVTVSPDARLIVSGSDDRTVKVWEVQEEMGRHAQRHYLLNVRAYAMAADAQTSASLEGLKILDAYSGEEVRTLAEGPLAGDQRGSSQAFHPRLCAMSQDGTFVVAVSSRAIKVWDLDSGEERAHLRGHENDIWACSVSPDGRRIVSADGDLLKVWDTMRGEELRTLNHGSVSACTVTPSGRFVASAGKTLTVWDIDDGRELRTLKCDAPDGLRTCVVSPDERLIVVGKRMKVLRPEVDPLTVFEFESGTELWSASGPSGRTVEACAVSPDGRFVVSAGDDHTLKIWEAHSGSDVGTLPSSMDPIGLFLHPFRPIAFVGDGKGIEVVDLVNVEYGPIIVSAIERDGRRTVRCPKCWDAHELDEAWLGQVIDCPTPTCYLRLRVNPFVVGPSRGGFLNGLFVRSRR